MRLNSAGASQYDVDFYREWEPITRASAAAIVPVIVELVSPRSVIDVGWGAGLWLAEFERAGVVDLMGIDG